VSFALRVQSSHTSGMPPKEVWVKVCVVGCGGGCMGGAWPNSSKRCSRSFCANSCGSRGKELVHVWLHYALFTEVEYPLLRACSSSSALRAAGLHTHVRTHRTSSDPAYLHTYVYLRTFREEEDSFYFRNPGLKRTRDFRATAPLKTATPESGSKRTFGQRLH